MDFLNTEDKRQRRMVHLPMGRFGEAIEIAKGALFRTYLSPNSDTDKLTDRVVASDESSYMTVSHSIQLIYTCNTKL